MDLLNDQFARFLATLLLIATYFISVHFYSRARGGSRLSRDINFVIDIIVFATAAILITCDLLPGLEELTRNFIQYPAHIIGTIVSIYAFAASVSKIWVDLKEAYNRSESNRIQNIYK